MSLYRVQKGFSLAELLVTIAIVAILMVLAAPSFQNYTVNQQIRSANDALMSALNLARSQAVTRNGDVTLRALPLADPDWVNGWEMLDGAGEIIAVHDALSGVTVNSAGVDQLVYNRDGRPSVVANFTVQSELGLATEPRCVRVGISGASSSQKGAC